MKKELYQKYFSGKSVTVMGLGLLGRGVGDTLFLAEEGASLIVTDKKSEEQLKTSLDILAPHNSISYVLGEHRLEDFESRDFVMKAAGVPFDSPYVKCAHDSGIPVYMSAALISSIVMKELSGVTIIGVTGTRGKSTVTALIAHILKSCNRKVHIGGNVRGVANLPLLKEIEDGDYLVLELDSWQLQGFGDMKISPHISVFTNFMDDHMNYYHGDRQRYFDDKSNIYKYQKEGDTLIVSTNAKEAILMYDKIDRANTVPVIRNYESRLLGEHNEELVSLAVSVAEKCGLDEAQIQEAIKTFSPVTGRLEDLGVYKGIRVINDNNATTGDATIKGIEAVLYSYHRNPILILGGSDKGLPLQTLEETIKEKTKAWIILEGTGSEKLSLDRTYHYEKLEDCINQAFKIAEVGDVILFSPGFASFGKYFNNEYERNDLFINEVSKYAN